MMYSQSVSGGMVCCELERPFGLPVASPGAGGQKLGGGRDRFSFGLAPCPESALSHSRPWRGRCFMLWGSKSRPCTVKATFTAKPLELNVLIQVWKGQNSSVPAKHTPAWDNERKRKSRVPRFGVDNQAVSGSVIEAWNQSIVTSDSA